jgi:hypothetical protein
MLGTNYLHISQVEIGTRFRITRSRWADNKTTIMIMTRQTRITRLGVGTRLGLLDQPLVAKLN